MECFTYKVNFPPVNKVVGRQSCLSVSLFTGRVGPQVATSMMPLVNHRQHWTSSLPSTLMAMPFPDRFKCVHYETHTSVGKRAVGIRLKCLLAACVPIRDSCAFVLSECSSPRGISVHQTLHAEHCYVINST